MQSKILRTIKVPDSSKELHFLGQARWGNRFEKVKERKALSRFEFLSSQLVFELAKADHLAIGFIP